MADPSTSPTIRAPARPWTADEDVLLRAAVAIRERYKPLVNVALSSLLPQMAMTLTTGNLLLKTFPVGQTRLVEKCIILSLNAGALY